MKFISLNDQTFINASQIAYIETVSDRSGTYLLITLVNGKQFKQHGKSIQQFISQLNN